MPTLILARQHRPFECAFGLGLIVFLELAAYRRTSRSTQRTAENGSQCATAIARDAIAEKPAKDSTCDGRNRLLVAIGRTAEDPANPRDLAPAAAVCRLHCGGCTSGVRCGVNRIRHGASEQQRHGCG